jgi:hypothetical protein
MREVRTRHWACGTEVVERVPEGYDLSEGLALVCPRCRDAWWYYPEPEPALATARADPAAAGEGGPEPAAPARHPLTPDLGEEELVRGTSPREGYSPARLRAVTRRPVNGLVHVWLGPPLMLAGIAVLVLALADVGPLREKPAPRPRAAVTAPSPVPPIVRAPSPAAATVRVAGRGFWLDRPRGWVTYRRASALVVAPNRAAPVSVRVYSTRRPDLSLQRMARLSARTLRSRLPGASVSRPTRVRLAHRRGLRVTARRGATVRQMTMLAAGARRYVLEVRTGRRASRAHRRAVAAITRSFRVRG